MQKFGIRKPCPENWNNMQPSEKGAFCQSCAKNVIDFSAMNLTDIKKTLLHSNGQEICGRMTTQQHDQLNADFTAWQRNSHRRMQSAFLFSLIVVFGLGIVSCSDQKDEKRLKEIHQVTQTIFEKEMENPQPPVSEVKMPRRIIAAEAYEEPDYVIYADSLQIEEIHVPEIYEIEQEYIMGAMIHRDYYTVEYLSVTTPAEERDSLGSIIPTEFAALAYPNPATGPVTLKLDLPRGDRFAIMLMDMNGRVIQQVFDGKLERGTAEVQFDLTDQPAGTYVVAIRSGSYKEVVKVLKI